MLSIIYSMDSQDNTDNLRVASFSAYLNSTDEGLMLKLTRAIQDAAPEIISPEVTPRPLSLRRSKINQEEGEIGVFGADKYFNMKMNCDDNPKLIDNRVEVELCHRKPKLSSGGTPSVSSEASLNSQNALLPTLLKNPSRIKQKKATAKRFLAGFGCNGPCLDKMSVHIDEGVVQKKEIREESFRFVNPVQSQLGLRGDDLFVFPVLKSGKENLTVKKQLEEEKVDKEESRYSIEVFGSHMIKKGDNISINLERKLSMLTWDAIPKSQDLPSTLPISSTPGPCDDIQSDASSDLFEIDTLSGTGHSLLTMQATENMSQYEPSEASIEWSVVTASAADFSTVSEYDAKSIAGDHLTSTNATNRTKTAKTKNIVCKEGQKGRSGGFLGCKTQKAVSVAEAAHRANEKAKSMKSQGDVWRKDFEFGPVQRSFASKVVSP
ncbi:unnamed protein product [Camellia sinensis]